MSGALISAVLLATMTTPSQSADSLRPPAIPLIAHDPYFSIWLPHEDLTAVDTRHWAGAPQKLEFTAEIDGKTYRLLGNPKSSAPALKQTNLAIQPTQVIATYKDQGVEIELTFLSATLATDLDLMAQPLSYIIWDAKSTDGKAHKVQVTFQANGRIAGAKDDDPMTHTAKKLGQTQILSFAKVDQPILQTKGDQIPIDWGTCYLAAANNDLQDAKVTGTTAGNLVASLKFAPLTTSSKAKTQYAILAYDDEYSIQYFEQNLRPYWRRNGEDASDLIQNAVKNLRAIQKQCDQFDKDLMADFEAAGGPRYKELASMAYRQCIAGSKLAADPNGQPLWFPKENSSNGCMATTDVIYPMSPQALLFGPALTKAMLQPVLAYGGSDRWKFNFAPHDLGTYPHANAQAYGGGETSEENQMPVEESANMLIMVAALAHIEGNADYAKSHWTALSKWAKYLVDEGMNPDNQLCTDDFLGHQAQNVNLSAKAIMGIRSYAELCKMLGKDEDALTYRTVAENFAARWIRESNDGDHSRVTFDQPNSWSQKYNLVWDRILGFNVFPERVIQQEMIWYRKNLNPYGLPLDSRGTGAKLDWSVWIATLTNNRADFNAIMDGVYRYVDETPHRIGLGDWYNTSNGNLNFFESRPVVGGLLIPLLYNEQVWKKWATQEDTKVANWAPIPPKPIIKPVVPAADTEGQIWQYTTDKPSTDWFKTDFNDQAWKTGKAGFGVENTPGAIVATKWDTKDIWLRRSFDLPNEIPDNLHLWLHHDDDVIVYVNGVKLFERKGWTSQYQSFSISEQARKALIPGGKNTIAIHCHQYEGGQYIDAGFATVTRPKR